MVFVRMLRSLVSQNHRRYLGEGYDLDLSYVTERIIAMSYPAQSWDSLIRNPMSQVQHFLGDRHADHYKVYNLCAELIYSAACFQGRVESFPSDDHYPPPLQMVVAFCESVDRWLAAHSSNVAVVHCKAGKGRTGVMVCSYLVYTGMHPQEALKTYALKRTTDNRGVSIPSQQRYVHYFHQLLAVPKPQEEPPAVPAFAAPVRTLQRIRLYDVQGAEMLDFAVYQNEPPESLSLLGGEAENQQRTASILDPCSLWPLTEVTRGTFRRPKRGFDRSYSRKFFLAKSKSGRRQALPESSLLEPQEDRGSKRQEDGSSSRWVLQMDTDKGQRVSFLNCNFDPPLEVKGDIRLLVFDSSGNRLFHTCFHTAFIPEGNIYTFGAAQLDKPTRQVRALCGAAFSGELLFSPFTHPNPNPDPSPAPSVCIDPSPNPSPPRLSFAAPNPTPTPNPFSFPSLFASPRPRPLVYALSLPTNVAKEKLRGGQKPEAATPLRERSVNSLQGAVKEPKGSVGQVGKCKDRAAVEIAFTRLSELGGSC